MSSRSPSLLALLGLAAVAGYQNRDKLSELFGQAAGNPQGAAGFDRAGAGREALDLRSVLGGRGGLPAGGLAGALLGGLSELVRNAGAVGGEASRKMDSWVGTGPNLNAAGEDIRALVGEETLRDLAERTGLGIEELEKRLAAVLPEAVNQMTPHGHLPEDGKQIFRVTQHG